ncbi:hypothetical protein, partial [Myceligenerans pegani]|uniref:hypothetical protein n=1 Tax=Myceligenerans pegani TaxID=2776917 RepID=UPI001CF079D6
GVKLLVEGGSAIGEPSTSIQAWNWTGAGDNATAGAVREGNRRRPDGTDDGGADLSLPGGWPWKIVTA